ncbi:hypothetical protein PF008_g10209 [Phytophthora fragariae]|uniref:Secreted protein n=1 Tax=Phytophthora fragariae TaxID=53985 RepID=A0A6G0RVZ9_9STRA|nr:hypothetical protein PF008_g10209 [Phytophthora fragariae]
MTRVILRCFLQQLVASCPGRDGCRCERSRTVRTGKERMNTTKSNAKIQLVVSTANSRLPYNSPCTEPRGPRSPLTSTGLSARQPTSTGLAPLSPLRPWPTPAITPAPPANLPET